MPHPDMNESWVGGHPDEGLLHEWLDEQLSARDAAELQAHVDSCAECQARVAEARGLMAASHRILSALDEVPANVIPTNIPEKAPSEIVIARTSNVRDASAVSSIDAARANAATKTKRVIPWNSIAKIAAVLVFAVAIAKSGFMTGDDAVAPMTVAKQEEAATAPAADARASDAAASAPAAGSSAIATLAAPAPAATEASDRPKVAAKSAPRQSGPGVASTRNQNVAGAVENTAAGAGTAEALADKRADDARVLRARVADAGVADRSEAEKRRASEPAPAAKASAALPELQGKVASMQVRTATAANASPPAGSPVATPPVASAPVATPAAPPANTAPVPLAAAATAIRARAAGDGLALNSVVTSASPPPAGGAAFVSRARVGRAAFDSVTLKNNACLPNCDTGTLWISARGELRYTFGSGTTQRSITGALPSIRLDSLSMLLRRTFPDSTTREGRMSCEVQQGEQIDLNIFFSTRSAPDRIRGCTRSTEEVRQFARSLEAMVLLESIKEALPPREP